jgi:hypothetical protein
MGKYLLGLASLCLVALALLCTVLRDGPPAGRRGAPLPRALVLGAGASVLALLSRAHRRPTQDIRPLLRARRRPPARRRTEAATFRVML